jgi:uncharacterized membrane protein
MKGGSKRKMKRKTKKWIARIMIVFGILFILIQIAAVMALSRNPALELSTTGSVIGFYWAAIMGAALIAAAFVIYKRMDIHKTDIECGSCESVFPQGTKKCNICGAKLPVKKHR